MGTDSREEPGRPSGDTRDRWQLKASTHLQLVVFELFRPRQEELSFSHLLPLTHILHV